MKMTNIKSGKNPGREDKIWLELALSPRQTKSTCNTGSFIYMLFVCEAHSQVCASERAFQNVTLVTCLIIFRSAHYVTLMMLLVFTNIASHSSSSTLRILARAISKGIAKTECRGEITRMLNLLLKKKGPPRNRYSLFPVLEGIATRK